MSHRALGPQYKANPVKAAPIEVRVKSTSRRKTPFGFGNEFETYEKGVKVLGEQVHGASFVEMSPPQVAYEYPIDHPVHDAMGNPVLFGTESPSDPVVETLGSNREGANTVATVLGAAIDESRRRWNMDPVPSTDLSSHSVKLVNKLINKGAIEPDSPPEQENSFGRAEGEKWTRTIQHSFNPDLAEEFDHPDAIVKIRKFSPSEVSHAQSTIRSLLRGKSQSPTNPNLSPTQFTQGELF